MTANAADDESDDDVELLDTALPGEPDDLPPIDFSTFVVSLRTSALMHLNASAEDAAADLPLARQEIDLLGILEEKTRAT